MTGDGQIRMSQGFDVLPPKSGPAFPIPCEEWDHLKKRLKQASTARWGFHTLGSALIGAALSPLLTMLSGGVSEPALTHLWTWVVVAAACGGLCLYFAKREAQMSEKQVSDIVAQMDLIEGRYPRSKDPAQDETRDLTIQSANYGAGGRAVDVTARLSSLIQNGRLDILINNDLAGDPCPGVAKVLIVDYLYAGAERRKQVNEHDMLRLP